MIIESYSLPIKITKEKICLNESEVKRILEDKSIGNPWYVLFTNGTETAEELRELDKRVRARDKQQEIYKAGYKKYAKYKTVYYKHSIKDEKTKITKTEYLKLKKRLT